jgi:putative CRISPR-associated protein (TIGR02619 family)
MMNRKQYILSPCGTSLLTNQAQDNEERKLVFKCANEESKNNLSDDDRIRLEKLIARVSAKIDEANYQEASKMSAEINGIIKIYHGSLPKNGDIHFLLSTDTWLGEETAKLVEKWLLSKNRNFITIVHRHLDLQTKEISAFQSALSDLIKKFSEEIPGYKKDGYQIIFNLTGGFKSVQGFLQSIANFYADETVYIFETSSELLRIPRLPISMDAIPIVEANIISFRRLAMGLPISTSGNIPETLLFSLDDEITLSPWGEMVWASSKSEIYKRGLQVSPSPKIRYGKIFEKRVASLAPDRIEMVNDRIDQLNKHLEEKTYNPPLLDFKPLRSNPMPPSTHEMDAWYDKDAKRIFGHFQQDVFILDKLDKGLH